MAAHLTLGLALVMLIGAPRVFAQGLSDPTRTAAGDHRRRPLLLPSSRPILAGAGRDHLDGSPPRTINGQAVALGGRYGNATLVRISDEAIVLQRPEGTETIKLYSSVQRTKRWASPRRMSRRRAVVRRRLMSKIASPYQ